MFQLNKLYNIDCMLAMKEIPDKYFDLAIVDPPYGIGEDGSKNRTRGGCGKSLAKGQDFPAFEGNDKEPPPKEYFNELMRVSKNQIIFGANHFISRIPYDSSCWIVWDKKNGNTDFADCELAWTSFDTAVRKFAFLWNGMLQENMKNKETRIHPTQKPIELYRWILSKYAKTGDKILDTHAGSCSSLIACYEEGFDFLGFELSKYYFEKGNERLQQRMAQIRMF